MSITRLNDGRYKVDIRPRGRAGRRIRKTFDRKRLKLSPLSATPWHRLATVRHRATNLQNADSSLSSLKCGGYIMARTIKTGKLSGGTF